MDKHPQENVLPIFVSEEAEEAKSGETSRFSVEQDPSLLIWATVGRIVLN